jgi:hypothetical protein
VLLEEACRAKDRLDRLDVAAVSGEWGTATVAGQEVRFTVGPAAAVREQRHHALLLAQLLAALRFPDPRTGRRPQRRPPRGFHLPRR